MEHHIAIGKGHGRSKCLDMQRCLRDINLKIKKKKKNKNCPVLSSVIVCLFCLLIAFVNTGNQQVIELGNRIEIFRARE